MGLASCGVLSGVLTQHGDHNENDDQVLHCELPAGSVHANQLISRSKKNENRSTGGRREISGGFAVVMCTVACCQGKGARMVGCVRVSTLPGARARVKRSAGGALINTCG